MKQDETQFLSVHASLEFYFTWMGRLSAPKSPMPADAEEADARRSPSSKGSCIEDRLLQCARIGKCLEVLNEEQRTVVLATFGHTSGQQLLGRDHKGAGIYSEVPAGKGRRREPLSFSGVARALNILTPGGEPDHRRVGRIRATAYHLLWDEMVERGVVFG
jgi:hypothetical protein